MSKSFASLYVQREQKPGYHAQELSVTFLAELTEAMRAQKISNAELARRIGSSAAYVTKVFRGPSNLSVETLAKLAMAVGCRASLHLTGKHVNLRWADVSARDVWPSSREWPARDSFTAVKYVTEAQPDNSNDEKFALAA